MGVLVPCALPCHTNKESSREHRHYSIDGGGFLHSESPTSSSISSQPSLPSVPSLTPSSISNNLQDIQEIVLRAHHNCIATLKPHSSSSYVCSLVLFPNFLFSGSSDGIIRAWSRPESDHVTVLPHSSIISPSTRNTVVAATNSAVKSLVVVLDHNQLVSAHQDHKIRVWKIDTKIIIATAKEHERHKKFFTCIATLPTLKDRIPRFLFPNSYVEIRRHKKCTWVHHADTVSALALSKDGTFLYSASWDRSFKIWRTPGFKCLASVSNAHDDAINAIVLSEDGAVICTASADKKIKLWKRNITRKKKHSLVHVGTLEKHKSAVNALAFSTDGCALYSGACDRSILVWERSADHGGGGSESEYSMVVVGALRGHDKAVLCLATVADLVCSGSADYSVRVWRRGGVGDRKCYSCLAVLEGRKRPVKCLTAAIDSDSNGSDCRYNSFLIYSGSLDCDIKVWKIRVPIC